MIPEIPQVEELLRPDELRWNAASKIREEQIKLIKKLLGKISLLLWSASVIKKLIISNETCAMRFTNQHPLLICAASAKQTTSTVDLGGKVANGNGWLIVDFIVIQPPVCHVRWCYFYFEKKYSYEKQFSSWKKVIVLFYLLVNRKKHLNI